MWSDVRYALRTLARERGFAAVAVLTLGLGIGANTAMFSLVNGILLKPLAFRDPGRLYSVREVVGQVAHLYPTLPVNGRHFLEWRDRCRSFEQAAIVDLTRTTVTGNGEPEEVPAAKVSAGFFGMLGVAPRLGRGFLKEEDTPEGQRVAILSDSLWRRRYGADRNVLGGKILVDGRAYTVVGVLPAGFRFPASESVGDYRRVGSRVDVYMPIALEPKNISLEGEFNYGVIARLKHGVTERQALSELNVIQAGLARQSGGKMDLRAWLKPLGAQLTADSRPALLVLMAAVGAVLLIVCVNLANVLLARATGRARDAAVRTALGASAGRLVRQTLVESGILALAGGALGTALATAAVRVVVARSPVRVPRLDTVAVDGRVLLFALALCAVTALLFGSLPAWRITRARPLDALRSGGRTGSEGGRRVRLRSLLVASEAALSTVLLVLAGLLLASFLRVMNTDKGFQVQRVLAADVALSNNYDTQAQRTAFYDRLLENVRALPGVISAGSINLLPLQGEAQITVLTLPGDRRPVFERPLAYFRVITPGYFETMGIPMVAGHGFDGRDRARREVIVSEATARKLWPGQNPIGKQLHDGDVDGPRMEVIGVAGDVRLSGLDKAPGLAMYYPHWHRQVRARASILIRTAMDPLAIARAVRAAVWSIDRDVAIPEIRTMREVVDDSVAQRRFQMMLVAAFAAAALLLASIGIYGVVSYTVARRRNEIGIRMALGARRAQVVRMVLAQGMQPVLAGVLAGVAAALATGRLVASLLFEVKPGDPATLASVAAVLALIAAAACYVPARRAARTDPMTALRYE